MFGIGAGFNNSIGSSSFESSKPSTFNTNNKTITSVNTTSGGSSVSSSIKTGIKALVGYEISKYNNSKRERSDNENRVRAVAGSGALGQSVQTAELVSEVGEAVMHSNIETNIEINNMIYDNAIKAGYTDEQAKGIIFDRCVNPYGN
jgi:hypothetical protein